MPVGRPARTRLGQWWLDLPLRRKGLLLTAVPLVVTVTVILAVVEIQHREADTRDEARASTRTLIDASLLTESVIEAESAVRGYAATGDPALLSSYEVATRSVPDAAERLREAPVGQHRERAATADSADAAVTALTDAVDELRARQGDPAAVDDALAPAVAAVDEFTGRSVELRALMLANITTDIDEALDSQDLSERILLVGLLLAIATSLAGGVAIGRSIIGRTVTLSDNVARFWAGEPLVQTPQASDEIGQLAASLGRVGRQLVVHQHELAASRDQALAATRAKDELLSRTSHELRTPLSAIIGFGRLLQMRDLDPEDRESVDHIVRAGHHLRALIDDVLDIATMETGQLSVELAPVAVRPLVEETVALVRAAADDRDIGIEVRAADVHVLADRQRLVQVLLNLLSNAVKYNHRGGRVTVDAVRDGGTVTFEVADTGPGIAPEDLDRLFQPFERLDAAERGIDGTGIGLSLSRGLVEAMGGRLSVGSEVGAGSTFRVELPAAPPPADDRRPDRRRDAARAAGRARPGSA